MMIAVYPMDAHLGSANSGLTLSNTLWMTVFLAALSARKSSALLGDRQSRRAASGEWKLAAEPRRVVSAPLELAELALVVHSLEKRSVKYFTSKKSPIFLITSHYRQTLNSQDIVVPLPFIIAGAAALAAGVGVKKGYDGHKKRSKADVIVDAAKGRYDAKRRDHAAHEKRANQALELLGEDELKIGQQLNEFKTIADALLKKLSASSGDRLEVRIPKHTLQDIERYSYQAIGVLGAIAGAGAGGAAAGFAVYGGVMALGAASTGTAISSLAGVAATNATLAAIGGGSLAAGGLGMAGGTMILGGAVCAPVLAIAGWAYNSHGEAALKKAEKVRREVADAVNKLGKAEKMLVETKTYAIDVRTVLLEVHGHFEDYFTHLKDVNRFVEDIKGRSVDTEAEFLKLGDMVLRLINNGYALAAILVDMITTPLFRLQELDGEIVKDESGVPVMATDADGLKIVNSPALDSKIAETRGKAALIEAA